jgi:hypothetical protein
LPVLQIICQCRGEFTTPFWSKQNLPKTGAIEAPWAGRAKPLTGARERMACAAPQ